MEGLYLCFRGKCVILVVTFHYVGLLSILCLGSRDRPELHDTVGTAQPRTLPLVHLPSHNQENTFSPCVQAFFRGSHVFVRPTECTGPAGAVTLGCLCLEGLSVLRGQLGGNILQRMLRAHRVGFWLLCKGLLPIRQGPGGCFDLRTFTHFILDKFCSSGALSKP